MIRASGGRAVVTVKKDKKHPTDSIRYFIAKRFGAWKWEIPKPKGHPQTPKLTTLYGRAHTHEQAVAAGLTRLREVYGVQA